MSHGHLEGEQPYFGDLLTMVIDHLINGMILQVGGGFMFFVHVRPKTWRYDQIWRTYFLKWVENTN